MSVFNHFYSGHIHKNDEIMTIENDFDTMLKDIILSG
jgi:hypothetical protein